MLRIMPRKATFAKLSLFRAIFGGGTHQRVFLQPNATFISKRRKISATIIEQHYPNGSIVSDTHKAVSMLSCRDTVNGEGENAIE